MNWGSGRITHFGECWKDETRLIHFCTFVLFVLFFPAVFHKGKPTVIFVAPNAMHVIVFVLNDGHLILRPTVFLSQ